MAESVTDLAEQVRRLRMEVADLAGRLAAVEKNFQAAPAAATAQAEPVRARATEETSSPILDGPPPLFDTRALLPRISTVCFLLVVALILRTITDNQIINTQAGSILGMVYAGILILAGWRLYAKNSSLAPVFPGCGILLLFSIVLETHGRYGSLSTNGAYAILFLAGAVLFALSLRFRASNLIFLAVPATAATAMAIDFPYPNYAVLGLILLAAIFASSYAFKQLSCRYLRWFTLLLTTLFWLLWTSKMQTLANAAEQAAAAILPTWFFPMLFLFWAAYLVTVVLNVLKKDLELGFFESIIPTLTAAGAFGAGYVAVTSWLHSEMWFHVLMVVIATLHLGLAWWLARTDREQASGANVFILAGACLIVFTSATVFKHLGYVLPVWSASAFVLALLSAHLHNEGIRVTSYLLQITACVAALKSGALHVPSEAPLAAILAAAALCVFSLLQYRWSRANPPVPTHSLFFSRIDRNNYSAVALLATGLAGGYFFSQLVLYLGLSAVSEDFLFPFKSGQSLIINIGALVLMYIALKGRDLEIIIVGAIVALIGAGKVFIFDLFGIKGVPLVLSVFSTGVVAAFGSVVMGKWQKKEPEAASPTSGQ
ncbi:MAG: hypothetical protein Kow0089_18660 [Desulfobulbaceae bacterium]